ncbi:hypothetical protein PsorP6_016511 [Peronosclerospora sorghi]|uniref:Uncharacterized protein n=1 Tax=Peronosclerospora sorghi TaxID=230839 RepID=A0ACC0VNU8_9STRA|nr:hypothetical protein PsorP6_016511 [Peronosclerospora sorghi]
MSYSHTSETTLGMQFDVLMRLEELKDGDVVDMKRYREHIGSMLYIANGTRPDICVSICESSQHLEAPKPAHMKAAIRVLRYLGGTSKFGL